MPALTSFSLPRSKLAVIVLLGGALALVGFGLVGDSLLAHHGRGVVRRPGVLEDDERVPFTPSWRDEDEGMLRLRRLRVRLRDPGPAFEVTSVAREVAGEPGRYVWAWLERASGASIVVDVALCARGDETCLRASERRLRAPGGAAGPGRARLERTRWCETRSRQFVASIVVEAADAGPLQPIVDSLACSSEAN